ncbi:hypothetical protein HP564_12400 [Pantoea sp. KPR_PJ]
MAVGPVLRVETGDAHLHAAERWLLQQLQPSYARSDEADKPLYQQR